MHLFNLPSEDGIFICSDKIPQGKMGEYYKDYRMTKGKKDILLRNIKCGYKISFFVASDKLYFEITCEVIAFKNI